MNAWVPFIQKYLRKKYIQRNCKLNERIRILIFWLAYEEIEWSYSLPACGEEIKSLRKVNSTILVHCYSPFVIGQKLQCHGEFFFTSARVIKTFPHEASKEYKEKEDVEVTHILI